MSNARRRATIVATATKWLAVVAALASPWSVSTDFLEQLVLLVAVAVIGVTLRLLDRHPALTLGATVALMAGAASAAGASGGPRSYAFAAVIVIAADAALQRGGGTGAILGGAGTLTTVLLVWITDGTIGTLMPVDLYALALTPLIGLAFGTLHRDLPIAGVVALRATTQALDELVALTRRVQPGLDRWGVAEAVVAGLRDHAAIADDWTTKSGPHLFIGFDGVLHGVGAPWHRRPVGLIADLPRSRRSQPLREVGRDALPSAIGDELGSERWLLHRFDDHTGGGAVLVDARTHPVVVDRIVETVGTATLALANSARFEELQSAATDAARTRLAHDLHDGIAQALTHARFELELLAMTQDVESDELRRARHAADAALAEVRRTIGELRDELPLSAGLRNHVETVRAFARVPVSLVIEGEHEPPERIGSTVLRIAQEAMSNALRHSGCSAVEVELQLDRDGLVLAVTDDGQGIGPDAQPGVGLRAIRERADSIGGDVRIAPGPDGGTQVELEVTAAAVGVTDDAMPGGVLASPTASPGFFRKWAPRRRTTAMVDDSDQVDTSRTGARVVVVDDHAMLRDSVSRALEGAGHEIVGGTDTPTEALSLLRIHEPDLLLADVNLGDGNDGIELAASAREEMPDLKVVVVSMHDDERTVKRALEAGVAGFVSKDAPLSELLDGVATVLGGSSYLSPRLAAKVMDLLSGRATTGPASLTDREAQILALLADGARASEIADSLFLAEKTVKNHLTSVYAKLGVGSAAQAVAAAHRLGLARPT